MEDWDLQYYFHVLRQTCQEQGLPQLAFPPTEASSLKLHVLIHPRGYQTSSKAMRDFRELMKDEPDEKRASTGHLWS